MTSMMRPLPTIPGILKLPKLVHELTKQDLEERYGPLDTAARVREARKRYCTEYNQNTSRANKLMNLERMRMLIRATAVATAMIPTQENPGPNFQAFRQSLPNPSAIRAIADAIRSDQGEQAALDFIRVSDLAAKRALNIMKRECKQAKIRSKEPRRSEMMQEVSNAAGRIIERVHAKHEKEMNKYCENCHESGLQKALDKCSHCFTVYYCGKECQTARWKAHKAEWLQHDTIVQETLLGHKPQPDSAFAFTEELCELISAYDHIPAKKS